MVKFEVGKKYITINGNGLTISCQFVGENAAFVKCLQGYFPNTHEWLGREWAICSNEYKNWIEYREPVKRWFNKYLHQDGGVRLRPLEVGGYPSERYAKDRSICNAGEKYLGAVEIEF